MKETIKLKDFLNEICKEDQEFAEAIKPEIVTQKKCNACGRKYAKNINFCNYDGQELVEDSYEVLNEEATSEIRRKFYDLSEGLEYENFPFKFVDTFESYDDDHSGEKYFINFIFERKSDGKFFEFTMDSWDDLGGDALYEVKKKTKKKTTWE